MHSFQSWNRALFSAHKHNDAVSVADPDPGSRIGCLFDPGIRDKHPESATLDQLDAVRENKVFLQIESAECDTVGKKWNYEASSGGFEVLTYGR